MEAKARDLVKVFRAASSRTATVSSDTAFTSLGAASDELAANVSRPSGSSLWSSREIAKQMPQSTSK
jgi:hypothetical protein